MSLVAVPSASCPREIQQLNTLLATCGMDSRAHRATCAASPDFGGLALVDVGCTNRDAAVGNAFTVQGFNILSQAFWRNPAAVLGNGFVVPAYPVYSGLNQFRCLDFSNYLAVPTANCTNTVRNFSVQSWLPCSTCPRIPPCFEVPS